jgi:guanylate kinase
VTAEAFQALISAKQFIEHATFSANHYGTTIGAVRRIASAGVVCILDIEMEGVKQVKRTDLNARFLFVAPPSLETLETRLRGRGTETEESLRRRLEQAERELEFAKGEGVHDRVVVNDDLEVAYREVEEFVLAEED